MFLENGGTSGVAWEDKIDLDSIILWITPTEHNHKICYYFRKAIRGLKFSSRENSGSRNNCSCSKSECFHIESVNLIHPHLLDLLSQLFIYNHTDFIFWYLKVAFSSTYPNNNFSNEFVQIPIFQHSQR